jgi:ketosteroid isomerase-like protein
MQKFFAPFLFFVLISWGTTTSAQTASDTLLALHVQKFDWMVAQDTAALAKLLHDDVVYIHSNGWHEAKTAILMNLVTGKLTYKKVTVEQSQVRLFGQMAIVNGVGIFEVALDGKPLTIKLDYTEVYSFEAGWKLVSRHACRVD